MTTIPTAQEMREKTERNAEYTKRFNKAVERITERIALTAARGEHECIFITGNADEERLIEVFKAKGYRFKQAPPIGGDWQDGKFIYW